MGGGHCCDVSSHPKFRIYGCMPCHVHAPFQVLGIGRLGFDVVPISLLYAVWDTVVPISLCMLFGAMLVDMVIGTV